MDALHQTRLSMGHETLVNIHVGRVEVIALESEADGVKGGVRSEVDNLELSVLMRLLMGGESNKLAV